MTFARSLGWPVLSVVMALGAIVYVRSGPGEGIRFVEVAEAAGLVVEPETSAEGNYRVIETMGSGVALIDDDDGWRDVVTDRGGTLPGDVGEGNGDAGNAALVGLKLVADSPSRSPVGARLRIRVGPRTLHRWVVSGGSYLASDDPRVLVGIARTSSVDTVEIRWPDGDEQRFENLGADACYEVSQGAPPRPRCGRVETARAEPR